MSKTAKLFIAMGCFALATSAQSQVTNNKYWSDSPLKTPLLKGKEVIQAVKYRTVSFDLMGLKSALSNVSSINDKEKEVSVIIELPHPDGTSSLYEVWENNTMHEGLKSKFPEIKAYDAIGLSGNFAKIDVTPHGFHAMILSTSKGSMFIDPYSMGDTENYKVYFKKDFRTDKKMRCDFMSKLLKGKKEFNPSIHKEFGTCELRTYRFAVAATGEYTSYHGGTVALAQAAQVTTMNRVNGVYERDMAITMTIIANNDLIIFTNSGSDPYTNGSPGNMINENQTEIDNTIGSSNYDIGHVFGTNSGGLAGLGVVCSNGNKARGVTGSSNPVGDPFDIDYVAHETGHQFGANHTQNNSCNRNNATAMEPGSASTIMGYAGICAPNVQSNSDDHFHGVSLEEMHNEIMSGGHTCEAIISLTNTAPTITATNGNVTVPANTPFALTATVTDPDGDALEYCWEQMDNTPSTQPPVATSTDGPNFRSNSPDASPTRYFPNLADLAAGVTPTWEVVPSVTRTMNFRVTVRDKPIGVIGCNDHADVTVSTDAGSGPFEVTYPTAFGITWAGTSTETVTWDVANTDNAPVSCAQVDILLSTDGGLTYPTVLASNVPNDGSETITVPNVGTTTARVMVICSNGTFFDISDNNFEITIITTDYTLDATPASIAVCQPDDAVYTVDVGTFGGYTDPVTLSAAGLPAGATGAFGTNPVTPGNTTTFTASNTTAAAPGTYTITISGNSTSGIKNVDVTLSISSGTPSTTTLTAPADGAIGVAVPVNFSWSAAGAGDVYDIDIATDAGFSSIVENAVGLTTNSYISSSLSPGTTYYWRAKAYNACGDPGFSTAFSFETVNEISLPTSGTATTQTTCTGILYDSGGSGSDYGNDEDAQITISPVGASTIDLTFVSFDIEPGSAGNCDYDWLDIYDGPTTSDPLIDRYCNDNVPTTLSSSGGSVTIVFHSDQLETHAGFQLNWQCNLSTTAPVANFDSDVDSTCTGVVQFTDLSPNGPTQWFWDFGDGTFSTDQNPLHTYTSSGDFTVSMNASNPYGSDSLTVVNMIYVNLPVAPTTTDASVCDSGSVTLTAAGSGILNWYDAPTGGTLVNTGGTYATPTLYAPTIYFVESEVLQSSLYGGKPDNSGGGGNFNNDRHLKFDVYEDFEIVSVEVYADGAGNRTIELRDNGGTVINSITANIPSGTSRVNLNFNVTPGTDYQLAVNASGMIDLYRNNASVAYPYDIAGMGSITRSSAGVAGGLNHYYFFYDWEVRRPACISARTPVSARVYPSPTVSGGADLTVCQGDTLTLSGFGAMTYSWTGGITDGVEFPAGTIGTTTYIVTGTDVNGCSDTATVNVTVNGNPTVSAGPDQTVCEGDSVALSGSGATSYSWSGGVVDNVGFVATSIGTTTYAVIGTDAAGCKNGDVVDVTVNEAPTIVSETPDSVSDCGLADGSITVVVSGGSGFYTYSVDSGATFVANGGAFTGLTEGSYNVVVDDGNCPVFGSTLIISAPGTPPAPSTDNDTTYCEGETIADLLATGTSGDLNWYSDAGLTTNIGSGGTLTPSGSTGTNTYYVTETIGGCEGPSSAVEIAINPMPNVNAGSDLVACEGDSLTLSGTGAVTYSWTGGIIDGATFLASSIGTTTYILVGTDANGCKDSDTLDISVNELPTIASETPVDESACGLSDGSITIAVSGGTGSYTYSIDGGATFVANGGTFTGLPTGNYSVYVNDGSCTVMGSSLVISGPPSPPAPTGSPDGVYCDGDAIADITASGTSGTLNWYSDSTLSTNIGTGGTLTPSGTIGTTTYYVTETVGACEGPAESISVTILTLPAVSAGPDQALCESDSMILAGSGALTYSWDNGVVDGASFLQSVGTVVYTVIGVDANGCENSDSVSVIVSADPDITVVNDSSGLTAASGYTYQWVDCDLDYNEIDLETGQSFTPTTSGNYAVVVNNAGCVDTSSCFPFQVSSVLEQGWQGEIAIYPNPSSGQFVFELSANHSVDKILILDATGRLVDLISVNNRGRLEVDISDNAAGVYFCRAEGKESSRVYKLIIE